MPVLRKVLFEEEAQASRSNPENLAGKVPKPVQGNPNYQAWTLC